MFVTHSVLEVLRGCRINVRGLVLLHCIKVVAEKYHQCPLFVRTYVQILSFKFTVEAIQFSCTSKILSERKRLVGSTVNCSLRNTHRNLKYIISLLITLMRIFLVVQVFLERKIYTSGSWKYFGFLCCHILLFIQDMLNEDHEVNRPHLQPSQKHKT